MYWGLRQWERRSLGKGTLEGGRSLFAGPNRHRPVHTEETPLKLLKSLPPSHQQRTLVISRSDLDFQFGNFCFFQCARARNGEGKNVWPADAGVQLRTIRRDGRVTHMGHVGALNQPEGQGPHV